MSLLWSGTASAQTLAAGEPAAAFDVTPFAAGVNNATDIAFIPGGRAVITRRNGTVVVRTEDGEMMNAGNIQVNAGNPEQGLLGVVADPAFATNNILYFYASAGPDAGARHRVLKITLGADNTLGAPTIIVDQDPARQLPGLEGPANHNGGGMYIYNNQLYIGVGDTGRNATPPINKNGTCLNRPNGKVLRVNLDGSVPDDNPLVGMAMVTGCAQFDSPLAATFRPDTRIFAWGFRNPWRLWVDDKTGKLWVGDVGETSQEEIGIGGKGMHFGWPFAEGSRIYNANGCQGITPSSACTPPAHSYPHANGDNSVTGGVIPDGCGWSAPWNKRYFFGDHGSGRMWTLDVNDARDGIVPNSLRPFATGPGPASYRMGLDHALYMVSHNGNSVIRFAPKGLMAMNCAPAAIPGGMGSNNGGTGGAPGTGTGGASGMGTGGASGSGGAVGSGGAAGSVGGTGGASGAGTGGTVGTGTGGSSSAGTGGSSTTGTAGTSGGSGASSGGGCQIGGGLPAAGLSLSALLLLAVGIRRRKAQ